MALSRAEAIRRVAVALDSSERAEVLRLARALLGRVGVAKVGLEAFSANGPALVAEVGELGMPVFLDLKLHDIPNTVERAARNAARLGVAMFTVHASGGEAMMRAAVAGAAIAARPPTVLAVTVLTSLDDAALVGLGIPGGAAGRVTAWAALAQRCGCTGVVCSPQEVAGLRSALGPNVLLVTPGVRPSGASAGDQRRVATPREAIAAGADLLVVGRPITAAPDPVAAAESIVAEMCHT
ncbi:MAG: orotidine 5'-phosphate decarboxylase [Acidobacteria bacterium RBG_13_68_16]|nr:MAG: orotidine 5'-phosphate decarboxylase [Acidobacteria bacterium RBG_13_68_16]